MFSSGIVLLNIIQTPNSRVADICLLNPIDTVETPNRTKMKIVTRVAVGVWLLQPESTAAFVTPVPISVNHMPFCRETRKQRQSSSTGWWQEQSPCSLKTSERFSTRAPTLLKDVESGSSDEVRLGASSSSSSEPTDQLRQYATSIQKASNDMALAMKPIRSLKRYLDSIPESNSPKTTQESLSSLSGSNAQNQLGDVLSSVLIGAFRTCGNAGDYRMITSLLQSAFSLCRHNKVIMAHDDDDDQTQLSPRVIGEALEAMGRTDASLSKLKQVYRWAVEDYADTLVEPLGPFQLNIMLKTLGEKNKIQAALDLYQSTDIVGDAFTVSTVLNLLTASIRDDQEVTNGWTVGDDSPCWQFEQGMQILRDATHLNNFVFSAALKLNERASQVFCRPGGRHNGAKAALYLLGTMKQQNIAPDLITCTHVLSAFDKHQEWKAAVVMLTSMEKGDSKVDSWRLPAPNEYAYSAAISACARCDQYGEAIRLLERMKRPGSSAKPNTWVYNAAISACVSPSKWNRNHRIQMALSLLDEMQSDCETGNLATAPDTVTYNTALAVMEGMGMVLRDEKGRRVCEYSSSEPEAWVASENLISEMLQAMRSKSIPRDTLTYHNAIKAAKSNSRLIFELLEEATLDLGAESHSTLTGRAGHGLGFVFNAALATFANRGDMDLMVRALNMMRMQNITATRESVLQLVVAMGRSRNSRNIMTLLESLRGNQAASKVLREQFGLDLLVVMGGNPNDLEQLYAVSISSCLVANDIESAKSVLNLMKENGLSPSQSTMKDIAYAYTRLAVEGASHQSTRRRKRAKYDTSDDLEVDVGKSGSSHAERAGAIVRELKDPSPQLLSSVASAYAATGSFEQARTILQSLHESALDEQSNSKLLSRGEQEILDVLPRLHRSLLKICAGPGNAQAAYCFVEDIQNFANNLSSSSREVCLADAPLIPDLSDPADFRNANLLRFNRTHTDRARVTGMRGEDWKLLLISASKAGDWKLCINTLQFLRPFLEAYHPSRASRSRNADVLSRKYRKLARALTASVLCFEERRQSAWAIRAVDDWIEWSGRRPPKEAVLASIRILSSQGRGTEVTSLIQQVLRVKASTSDSREEAQHTYEEILYIGAITHLHNNGLYEDADELYLQAITNQYLPFSVATAGSDGHQHLDLHGMNVAIANSAVRIAFQQDVLQSKAGGDLLIVTGRGINSFYQMRPILRPEIQRMLTEEFYPPLSTFSMPGNMGALRVPAGDIQAWAEHQRQQRGVKMLAVADALKNLSSGLLRRSLNLSLKRKQGKQD